MRVLICGSRNYRSAQKVHRELTRSRYVGGSVVIHGAAPGADSLAELAARQLGVQTESFPAKWDILGKGAGSARNTQMLEEGKPDLIVAFVKDPTRSPGTANMVLQALCAGIPVEVIHP